MSDTHLWEFQFLLRDVQNSGVPRFGPEVLLPWLDERPQIIPELHQLGRPELHRRQIEHEVSWGLYALSRLVEVLIAAYQPVDDDPALLAWTTGRPWWRGPVPPPRTWPDFTAAIGAATIAQDAFHPFFHEVVGVIAADDPDQPVELVEQVWPGAVVGGLVLTRAGVVVRASANHLEPSVAEKSCLYWSWWRRNRVARDLSHGWGHNSQWRTSFRRDYIVGDELHYNVDARLNGSPHAEPVDQDISAEDQRELLRWRHSRTVDLGDDRWPYNEWLVEPRSR